MLRKLKMIAYVVKNYETLQRAEQEARSLKEEKLNFNKIKQEQINKVNKYYKGILKQHGVHIG